MPPDSTPGTRDARGRFQPGASGNPGGRRPSLTALIRTRTRDGASLVRFLLGVMRDPQAVMRDRLRAVELLMVYGFSKPVAVLEDAADAENGLPLVPLHVFQKWLRSGTGEEAPDRLSLEAARAIIDAGKAEPTKYTAEWGDGSDAGRTGRN